MSKTESSFFHSLVDLLVDETPVWLRKYFVYFINLRNKRNKRNSFPVDLVADDARWGSISNIVFIPRGFTNDMILKHLYDFGHNTFKKLPSMWDTTALVNVMQKMSPRFPLLDTRFSTKMDREKYWFTYKRPIGPFSGFSHTSLTTGKKKNKKMNTPMHCLRNIRNACLHIHEAKFPRGEYDNTFEHIRGALCYLCSESGGDLKELERLERRLKTIKDKKYDRKERDSLYQKAIAETRRMMMDGQSQLQDELRNMSLKMEEYQKKNEILMIENQQTTIEYGRSTLTGVYSILQNVTPKKKLSDEELELVSLCLGMCMSIFQYSDLMEYDFNDSPFIKTQLYERISTLLKILGIENTDTIIMNMKTYGEAKFPNNFKKEVAIMKLDTISLSCYFYEVLFNENRFRAVPETERQDLRHLFVHFVLPFFLKNGISGTNVLTHCCDRRFVSSILENGINNDFKGISRHKEKFDENKWKLLEEKCLRFIKWVDMEKNVRFNIYDVSALFKIVPNLVPMRERKKQDLLLFMFKHVFGTFGGVGTEGDPHGSGPDDFFTKFGQFEIKDEEMKKVITEKVKFVMSPHFKPHRVADQDGILRNKLKREYRGLEVFHEKFLKKHFEKEKFRSVKDTWMDYMFFGIITPLVINSHVKHLDSRKSFHILKPEFYDLYFNVISKKVFFDLERRVVGLKSPHQIFHATTCFGIETMKKDKEENEPSNKSVSSNRRDRFRFSRYGEGRNIMEPEKGILMNYIPNWKDYRTKKDIIFYEQLLAMMKPVLFYRPWDRHREAKYQFEEKNFFTDLQPGKFQLELHTIFLVPFGFRYFYILPSLLREVELEEANNKEGEREEFDTFRDGTGTLGALPALKPLTSEVVLPPPPPQRNARTTCMRNDQTPPIVPPPKTNLDSEESRSNEPGDQKVEEEEEGEENSVSLLKKRKRGELDGGEVENEEESDQKKRKT